MPGFMYASHTAAAAAAMSSNPGNSTNGTGFWGSAPGGQGPAATHQAKGSNAPVPYQYQYYSQHVPAAGYQGFMPPQMMGYPGASPAMLPGGFPAPMPENMSQVKFPFPAMAPEAYHHHGMPVAGPFPMNGGQDYAPYNHAMDGHWAGTNKYAKRGIRRSEGSEPLSPAAAGALQPYSGHHAGMQQPGSAGGSYPGYYGMAPYMVGYPASPMMMQGYSGQVMAMPNMRMQWQQVPSAPWIAQAAGFGPAVAPHAQDSMVRKASDDAVTIATFSSNGEGAEHLDDDSEAYTPPELCPESSTAESSGKQSWGQSRRGEGRRLSKSYTGSRVLAQCASSRATRSDGGNAKPAKCSDDGTCEDSVLRQFKSSKGRIFQLKDIAGHLYEFSQDQHGSYFVQNQLKSITPQQLSAVLDELMPRVLDLVMDAFGNYVVQNLFAQSSSEQRIKLAECLHGNVLPLSLHPYGCRIVQKALAVLPTEHQLKLVAELECEVLHCAQDQHGNHVIQKVIQCVPTDHITQLLDSLIASATPLSLHPFGCHVILHVLQHCQDAARQKTLMDEILKSAGQLARDQHGNCIVQHVLEHGTSAERSHVINQLAPQVSSMAMHKFASYVLQKCLMVGSEAERNVLIGKMLGDPKSRKQDPLQQMVKDQFGKYVVQTALEVGSDMQRRLMLGRINAVLSSLRFTQNKHMLTNVEKLVSLAVKLQDDAVPI